MGFSSNTDLFQKKNVSHNGSQCVFYFIIVVVIVIKYEITLGTVGMFIIIII